MVATLEAQVGHSASTGILPWQEMSEIELDIGEVVHNPCKITDTIGLVQVLGIKAERENVL